MEVAHEFPKDVIFDKSNNVLNDQIYILGQGYRRIFRLVGQTDIAIAECPILLSVIYDPEQRKTLKALVLEEHRRMWTFNILLNRVGGYVQNGRNETEVEAIELDQKIKGLLDDNNIDYLQCDGTPETKSFLVKTIQEKIRWRDNNYKNSTAQ